MLLELFYRRGWGATLVGSNEDPKLELPRVWELLDKSKPSQISEGTSSHGVFSYGETVGYKGF